MDNFFRNWFGSRRESISTPQVPSSTATGGTYDANVVHVQSPNAALTIAAWHRAVELRAKTMGQLVIEYQRWSASGRCYETAMYGDDRRINYLLQKRPNPLMTATVLMQQAEINIITKGNALIYIQRDTYGVPVYFWLAMLGGYNPETDTYALTYQTDRGVRALFDVPSSDVLHIPNTFRDYGGYTGIPTLTYAAQALNLAATQDGEAMANAAKGGKMKLLLQQDKGPQSFGVMAGGLVNKKELKRYADELNDDIYQKDVIALHGITGVTPISMSSTELQLLQSRQFQVAEIARLTGVPKALLMDDSQSSYKTPEAATEEFMLRTIQPKMQEWEDELDSKLLGWEDFGKRRFCVKGDMLRRLDLKGQAETDKLQLETGVKTVNELRYDHNLPRVEDGDLSYISTNLARVGSEKLEGTSNTTSNGAGAGEGVQA